MPDLVHISTSQLIGCYIAVFMAGCLLETVLKHSFRLYSIPICVVLLAGFYLAVNTIIMSGNYEFPGVLDSDEFPGHLTIVLLSGFLAPTAWSLLRGIYAHALLRLRKSAPVQTMYSTGTQKARPGHVIDATGGYRSDGRDANLGSEPHHVDIIA